jgi:hypothetical protein
LASDYLVSPKYPGVKITLEYDMVKMGESWLATIDFNFKIEFDKEKIAQKMATATLESLYSSDSRAPKVHELAITTSEDKMCSIYQGTALSRRAQVRGSNSKRDKKEISFDWFYVVEQKTNSAKIILSWYWDDSKTADFFEVDLLKDKATLIVNAA